MDEKRLTPRARFLVGCGGCAGLIVVGILVIAWSGYSFARNSFKTSPEDRQAAALDLLGTERLPEGYYAVGALRVPMVLNLAILSNRPPSEGGAIETGDSTFFFARASPILSISGEEEDRLFEIAGLELDGLAGSSVEEAERQERSDLLDIAGGQLRYTRYSGGARFQGQPIEGRVTVMAIRCRHSDLFQAGLWILPEGPEPVAGATVEQTTRDEPLEITAQSVEDHSKEKDAAEILAFVSQFTLCAATE